MSTTFTKMKNKTFRPSSLAALVTITFSLPISASVVRSDVDYQYFRDFAENKGKFAVGASNVEINNLQGKRVGTMLPNIPMPDLSAGIRNAGYSTLIAPQYLVSAAHNTPSVYRKIEFGAAGNNPDANHYTYKIVDRNDHENVQGGAHWDYHTPRLNKLVTEVVPATISDLGNNSTTYLDTSRFTMFARAGAGRQNIRDTENKNTQLAGSYAYLIGGTPLAAMENRKNQPWLDFSGSVYDNKYGPLATYSTPGDSGSAIYGYDSQTKRWVVVAVTNFYGGMEGSFNRTGLVRKDYHERKFAEDSAGQLENQQAGAIFEWQANGNNSLIRTQNNTQQRAVSLADRTIKDNKAYPKGSAGVIEVELPQEQNGKTLNFSGKDATIVLKSDIDQGAGALNFDANVTVRPENDQTWLGAGITVAPNKQVTWQVKNPQGDRLSKLGAGTLYVNGGGENLGDISVGDGTVILNQQVQNGKKQAFNQIGIVSGRPTVVLNSADQVNPNNIYFGFRGGRLDLNGNSLTFNRLQNTDDGAKIVNSSATSATLTLATPYSTDENHHRTFNGFIGETDNAKRNGALNVVYDPQASGSLATSSSISWGKGLVAGADIYQFTNKQDGIRDYFALKGNPKNPTPTNHQSNDDWEYLSSNRQEAINKVLARKNAPLEQEKLNNFYVVSGGLNLNGNLTLKGGKFLLSGRPTPHAYDVLNKQDVVYEDDWQNRQFSANQMMANGWSQLYVGRNVSSVTANLSATDNAQLNLGFINGQSPSCYYSEYSGVTNCTQQAVISEQNFASLPTTQIVGNTRLSDNSQLNLGKAHLQGTVQADNGSQMTLSTAASWTNNGNSTVGNLRLEQGSSITLNERFANGVPARFNKLIVNGNLSGVGKINYVTDIGSEQGDHVLVNGVAEGQFTLALRNSGKEATSVSPLSLFTLTNAAQNQHNVKVTLENGYVDLGAYRYILANRNHDYRLYNPLKDAENRNISAVEATKQLENATRKAEQQRQEATRLAAEMTKQRQAEQTAKQAVTIAQAKLNEANAELSRLQQQSNNYMRYYPSYARQLQGQITAAKQKVAQATSALKSANGQATSAAERLKQAEQAVASAQNIANRAEASLSGLRANVESAKAGLKAEMLQLCQDNGTDCSLISIADNEEVMPINQSDWMSQYANTALSELSAQANSALQIGNGIVRQLFTHSDKLYVWSSLEHQKTEHKSDLYRPYEQQTNLIQLGAEMPLARGFTVGAVLSKNHANAEFDEGVNGKSNLLMASLYAKWMSQHGTFVSLDGSHGKAKNRINLFGENHFSRDISAVGVSLGQEFEINGLHVQPSIATRYYRLSGKQYNLGEVEVNSPTANIMTYQAGLKVSKAFTFSDWKVEPSLATHYVDANSKRFGVKVNGNTFEQRFGRYLKSEAGIVIERNQWLVAINAGFLKGNEIQKQRFASFKIGYRW